MHAEEGSDEEGSRLNEDKEPSSAEIDSLFDKIDTNASGSVSKDELFAGLKASSYSAEYARDIVAAMNADGSRKISRVEFRSCFLSILR